MPLDHIHRCHSCLGDILSEQLTRTFTLADGYWWSTFPPPLTVDLGSNGSECGGLSEPPAPLRRRGLNI